MRELLIKISALDAFKKLNHSYIPLVKALILVLPLLITLNAASLTSKVTEPKNVLVLASYKATAPVATLWNRGMETVFKSENSGRIDVNVEYLDLINFNDAGYKQLLSDNLRQKLLKYKPDLVIPIYNRALGFVFEHRDEIFAGIPVVFAGVEQKFLKGRKIRPDIINDKKKFFSDLKYMKSIEEKEWKSFNTDEYGNIMANGEGEEYRNERVPFWEKWDYWLRMAIYFHILYLATGDYYTPYMPIVTKEKPPDLDVLNFSNESRIVLELKEVEQNIEEVLRAREGWGLRRCGRCYTCRKKKVFKEPRMASSLF